EALLRAAHARECEPTRYPDRMRASSLFVGGWWAHLTTSGAARTVVLPPPESPDWDALEVDVAQHIMRFARTTCLFLIGLVCVGWLVETLTVTRDPALQAAFRSWRLSVIAITAGAYVTLSLWRRAERFPVLAFAPFLLAGAAVLAHFLSTI